MKITIKEKQFILKRRKMLAMSDQAMIYEEMKSKLESELIDNKKNVTYNLMNRYKIDKKKAEKIIELFRFVDITARMEQRFALIEKIEKIIGE